MPKKIEKSTDSVVQKHIKDIKKICEIDRFTLWSKSVFFVIFKARYRSTHIGKQLVFMNNYKGEKLWQNLT